MTGDDSPDHDGDASTRNLSTLARTAASTTYKVLGEDALANGAGVLGKNTAGSGTPIGVEGAVPNSSQGYGLSTPDDARVEGQLKTDAVTASSGSPLTLSTDDGSRTLELGVPTSDGTHVAGGNVVAGHPNNAVNGSAVGVTIGGGGNANTANTAGGNYATVGGGEGNDAPGRDATVGGGEFNTAAGKYATVAGGRNHQASGTDSAIVGGTSNEAPGFRSFVGGGIGNVASGKRSVVSGGDDNLASGDDAVVAGGTSNAAKAANATVGGGQQNTATSSENATIVGGSYNGANGFAATAAGGVDVVVDGDYSWGAGWDVRVPDDYAFAWTDGTRFHDTDGDGNIDAFSTSKEVVSGSGEPTGTQTFNVVATGGVRFVTGSSSVTYIPSLSTGWSTASSRAVKTNVDPVDPDEALEGVTDLEVATWEYEADDGEGTGVTHVGPMAEEFHEAFDVGDSDRHINSINARGVAFAAIQGLADRLADTRDDGDARDERIEELEAENERLRERLAALEERVDATGAPADD